ncbi:hypothetical protein VBL27_24380 [Enterobacter cloacae]|uniref:hypothetical protein n=1 Tax=Enterobacter cloacae TaxID=550 RepID=UPI002B1E4260|nr:hypothetical protein [Enterobacter cloacae]MEA3841761.1 hypothetical protein [Enterobacter cloacae]
MNIITIKQNENDNYTMRCYGCVHKCAYASIRSTKCDECSGTEFYIWPENNSFLIEGILQYFSDINSKIISQPIVVIDFNYKNINYFLSNNWLAQFRNSRLILITDKKMTAIAHYWFYNDTADTIISTVIFHDDLAEDIKMKISQSFMGKIIRPSEKRAKLSANEYALFSELYKGQLPKKIAMKNATNVKNIYAMKIRIETKLGVPISRLAS